MNVSHQNILTRSVIKTTVSEILRDDDKESDDDKPILKSMQSIYSNIGESEFDRSSSKEKKKRRIDLLQLKHFLNDDTDNDYVNDELSRFYHVPYHKNKSVGTDNSVLTSNYHEHKANQLNNGFPYQSIPYQSPYLQQMAFQDPFQTQRAYSNCMPCGGFGGSNLSINHSSPFQNSAYSGNPFQSGYLQTPLQNSFLTNTNNNCSPFSPCPPQYLPSFQQNTHMPNSSNCYINNGLYRPHYFRPGYGNNNRNQAPKKSCFKRFINMFINNDNGNRSTSPKNVSFDLNPKIQNLTRNYFIRESPYFQGYSQIYTAAQSPCQPMWYQQQQQQIPQMYQMHQYMHPGNFQTSQTFNRFTQSRQTQQTPVFPTKNQLFNNFSPNANAFMQTACNKCNTHGNHGFGVHPQPIPAY